MFLRGNFSCLQLNADCQRICFFLVLERNHPSFDWKTQMWHSLIIVIFSFGKNVYFVSSKRKRKNTRTNKNICLHTRTHENLRWQKKMKKENEQILLDESLSWGERASERESQMNCIGFVQRKRILVKDCGVFFWCILNIVTPWIAKKKNTTNIVNLPNICRRSNRLVGQRRKTKKQTTKKIFEG